MNKQAPKENFTDLAADLAMCIADVLDHPDTPNDLRDVLNETVDELTTAIGPSVSEHLRALAGPAKVRDRGTRPEGKALNAGRLNANAASGK
jgi:hypothetical protein